MTLKSYFVKMITTAIVTYQHFPNHYGSSCQVLKELGKCTKTLKEAQTDRAYPALVQVHFSVSKSVSTISSFTLKNIYCSSCAGFGTRFLLNKLCKMLSRCRGPICSWMSKNCVGFKEKCLWFITGSLSLSCLQTLSG